MEISDKTIAVILASGSGSRFGSELPKQYCDMLGRPLLMRTIDCFAQVMPLDSILLVIDSRMEDTWRQLCAMHGFHSPRMAFGGVTRSESLAKALGALADADDDTTVMIHDGARPMASSSLIRRMAAVPEGYAGAVPAVAVTDTLRHIGSAGAASSAVDRSAYVAVQTPQTFQLGTLRKAYARYREYEATDDATMVERATGGKIAIVEGDTCNIKVTNPADIAVAEALLSLHAG